MAGWSHSVSPMERQRRSSGSIPIFTPTRICPGRNPNSPPCPKWLHPTFPRNCPYCGLPFMNFFKLGGHLTAHRREKVANNRRFSGPQTGEGGGERDAPLKAGVVPLGVLEKRIDVGTHLPQTLDLLGIGEKLLGQVGGDEGPSAANQEEDGEDAGEEQRSKRMKLFN